MASEPILVPMEARHLPRVMEIERASFADPWPPSAFLAELSHGWSWFKLISRPDARVPIAGFIICWMLPGDMHILNLAVDPAVRGRGLARRMLEAAILDFAAEGGGVASLEVRPTNEAARKLYGSFGFVQVGVRKRYYRRDNEDALVLLRQVGPVGVDRRLAETGD